MPTRLAQWIGIGLIGLGVFWQSQLAPSLVGWGFILIGFLALLVTERRWPARTPLDAPLLLLAVMGGVSLLVTARPEVTQVQVMRLWAGLAGFYGLVNWARDRTRLLQTAAILAIGGVGMALLAPFVVDWNRTKSMLIPSAIYEPFPLLVSDPVHPNIMATLMLLLFPLPLAAFLSPRRAKAGRKEMGKRMILGVAFLLMGIVLLLTKSRGGYITAVVGGLMVGWLSARRRRSFVLALVLIAAVIGIGTWFLFGVESETTPELVAGATDPNSWGFRQQVWRAATWTLSDFAFTGVGMGLFNDVASLLYAHYAPQNPGAHNVYLQVGVDLGFPGLIAYLAVLMLTLWMASRSLKTFTRTGNNALCVVTVGALSGMAAFMAHGLVDITVWGTRAAFFPWLIMGLITALFEISIKRNRGDETAKDRKISPRSQPPSREHRPEDGAWSIYTPTKRTKITRTRTHQEPTTITIALAQDAGASLSDPPATTPCSVPPPGPVGLAICYDIRFPELLREMALAGAVLFLGPAQWPVRRVGAGSSWSAPALASFDAQVGGFHCELGGVAQESSTAHHHRVAFGAQTVHPGHILC